MVYCKYIVTVGYGKQDADSAYHGICSIALEGDLAQETQYTITGIHLKEQDKPDTMHLFSTPLSQWLAKRRGHYGTLTGKIVEGARVRVKIINPLRKTLTGKVLSFAPQPATSPQAQ